MMARVGCSGWNYRSWRGPFYPRDLPVSQWLEHYARVFDTVEVNNTFYRLPERTVFMQWHKRFPAQFQIAVKASRFLTHMKRLRDPAEPLERLFSRAIALDGQLGPVLYQLPPTLAIDLPRLERFLALLPRARSSRRIRHVMEFRHPSWYTEETFDVLRRQRVTLCLHDKSGSTITSPFVGPFVYVRFHGPSGRYSGSYSQRQLDAWAHRLVEQLQDGRPVFAYFNNDPDATAVRNALTLRTMIEKI